MEATVIVEGLAGFTGRGAGTDAERRAAAWLANELSRDGSEAEVETFWCRPNWPLAHALHAALAVAGSLLSLISPIAGVTILAVALASVIADALSGISLGRRLTSERASQNVLVRGTPAQTGPQTVRLILTAAYDTTRRGVIYRSWLRRPTAWLRQALRSTTPGWLGWFVIAIIWLLATAVARLEGQTSQTIGAVQLPPTVALLIAFALLLDQATASTPPSSAEGDATAVALATALASALQTAPPRHLDVELLLMGAGQSEQLGLRRHLRRHRAARTRRNTVVLGFAPCAAGRPCWWFSDGPLIPLRYARSLRRIADQIATEEPSLHASPHKGRGSTAALPARMAGIPAITLGCLAPHQTRPTTTDDDPLDAALQFALLMVDAVDSVVGDQSTQQAATPA